MKKVFAQTSEVCAVWAAQEQDEARTGSNTRFRGVSLYSYGTEIARIVTTARAQRVALVSSRKRSTGTSKVQGEARAAARKAGMPVYTVALLDVDAMSVTLNLENYEADINSAIAAVEKAVRWDTAIGHRNTALQLLATAHLYAADMAVGWTWKGRNPLSVRNPKEPF